MIDKPLPLSALVRDAVRAIEASRRRTAVVVETEGRLLGTLTDGDIRRCLLAGGSLDSPVTTAMNPQPIVADVNSTEGLLLDKMKHANILCIPLVDKQGRYVRLVHLTDFSHEEDNAGQGGFAAAVIMAGGEGSRLRPLTANLPKPMIEIGGAPLLERLITRLHSAGIPKVFISVNYLAYMIEEHLGNGCRFDINIDYLRERTKLGTAGPLSLLPERPDGPIIVVNGDILTTSDFNAFYAFHEDHGAAITAAAVNYRIEIPYGVIRSEGAFVRRLEEKPAQQFLCNAGIYAVSPTILDMVPQCFYNMTDLIEDCLRAGEKVAAFPLHEYWSDIGTPSDLEKARAAFEKMTA